MDKKTKQETGHPAQFNYNRNEVFGGILFFVIVLIGMYIASNFIK